MRPEGADSDAKCPVDPKTREKWLEAAKAKGQQAPAHPSITVPTANAQERVPRTARFSLDSGRWGPPTPAIASVPSSRVSPPRPRILSLDTHREISTIPRSLPNQDRDYNAAERAALPSNSEADTGHDKESGNWIYPSQEMFFNAMKRKGHDAQPQDMSSIVPIHNAVNERAWNEIKKWEAGRGSETCGGPKLVSFAGDSKALTPKARWNAMMGYSPPFDRHDWVIDRCGKHVDYVIDFYSGKDEGMIGKSLSFYLDARPKLNSWEAIKTRVLGTIGM